MTCGLETFRQARTNHRMSWLPRGAANLPHSPGKDFWDILYRDFPEIYDEFAAVAKKPPLLQVLMNRFDFRDKVVADVGSGSGLSAFEIARLAKKVTGVE